MSHATRMHDRFSPSGADRWLVCPASVLLAEKLGCTDSPGNEASERGTAAHELLEQALKAGKSPEHWRGKTFNGYKMDDSFIEPVDAAFDYIRQYLIKGAKLYTEHEVTVPGVCTGHLDAAVVAGRAIHVFDYKNGRHRVHAEGNNQMRLYAAGVVEMLLGLLKKGTLYSPEGEIVLHIVQPNANPEVGDTWTTTWRDLSAWVRDVAKPAAAAILAGTAEFDATDPEACKYCPARGRCKPYAEHNIAATGEDWADVIKGKAKFEGCDLTAKEVVALVAMLPGIAKWADAVQVEAMRLARSGKLPGYKIVAGQSRRAWVDAAQAKLVKKFGSKVLADPKLRGIGIIEKLAKDKKLIASLVTMRLGGPKLVPKTDPRPDYAGDAALDFEDDLHDT